MTGVLFPLGAGNFSLRHRVQIDSGAYPASYPIDTEAFFPEVKWPGREADHLPPPSAYVKNTWRYTFTPIHQHGVVLLRT